MITQSSLYGIRILYFVLNTGGALTNFVFLLIRAGKQRKSRKSFQYFYVFLDLLMVITIVLQLSSAVAFYMPVDNITIIQNVVHFFYHPMYSLALLELWNLLKSLYDWVTLEKIRKMEILTCILAVTLNGGLLLRGSVFQRESDDNWAAIVWDG
jgi:hypothetical protein